MRIKCVFIIILLLLGGCQNRQPEPMDHTRLAIPKLKTADTSISNKILPKTRPGVKTFKLNTLTSLVTDGNKQQLNRLSHWMTSHPYGFAELHLNTLKTPTSQQKIWRATIAGYLEAQGIPGNRITTNKSRTAQPFIVASTPLFLPRHHH